MEGDNDIHLPPASPSTQTSGPSSACPSLPSPLSVTTLTACVDPNPPLELNYQHQILDEICLEGLDGLTLQAVWLRLRARPGYTLGLSDNAKQFVWEIIERLDQVCFYRLKQPRPDLVLHDRYQHMDGDLGIVIEPDDLPEDIYPFCLVDDQLSAVKGSCWTYSTRKEMEKGLTLEEAVTMGGKFVMVGSQDARTEALIGEDWDPLHVLGVTATQWAILERVGRARYQGEVTQGKLSLQAMNENPKTLFYHRKALLTKGLILKQVHHQKSRGQNFQGTLFHLPRFYVERKPKALILVRNAIEFLKTQENGVATYEDVRNYLNLGNSVKKLFKTHEFQRFMKGDVRVPYRSLYPGAEESEWKRKGTNQEKSVRVVKLLDLEVEPDSVFGDEEDETMNKTQLEALEGGATPAGILDQSGWLLDRTMMWQAYAKVEEAGSEGLSQQQLGQKLGQGKLEARTICRNLLRRDLVVTVMKDIGRQRVTNFVAKKWQHLSHGAVQYQVEKERNDQLTGNGSAGDADPQSLLKIELTEQDNLEDADLADAEDDEFEDELMNMKPSTSKIVQVPTLKKERISLEAAEPTLCKFSPVKDKVLVKESNPSESMIHDDDEDTPMEISITSGFSLPDENSLSKTKNVKRQERKGEARGETYRQLKRSNTIIEAVRLHKVIDDPTKLYKMIQENEAKEGHSAKMDKKSLMRLISKLGKEGQIHNIRCVFKHGDKKKVLHFVCEPGIDESNTVIQSAIEQAKMKFNIQPRITNTSLGLVKDEQFLTESVSESLAELGQLENVSQSPTKAVSMGRIGRKYGLQPKFVKMRELHLLLYYLIYGYSGEPGLDQREAAEKLSGIGLVDDDVVEEMSDMVLYSSEVSWKMFIPPLPAHQGWGQGWCLMCDILLRLPLSIFVKLINITMEVPGLQDYLTHPVRRNYLIRSLPHSMRNKMLYQRKYIFAVHEVATRLAYIGVLQFGPQKLKEKDQVFLFMNRHASLLDTTTSGPGYHQVDADKNFPLEEYTLSSLPDVEQFWHRLWEVCIFTPLGGSSALSGQEITLEVMERKQAMIDALSPKNAEEAEIQDDGTIPGDGLGAAGLDSSIFAHLKRNWTWNSSAMHRKGDKLAAPPFIMSEISNKSVTVKTSHGRTKVTVSKQPNVKRTTKGQKRKRANSECNKKDAEEGSDSKTEDKIKFRSRRPSVFTRVVGRKRTATERKPYYDEKDKAALRLMRKLRVDWSAGEDSFLLLCKVAGSFLCSNSRNQMVQYTAVRDLLHEQFPESQNKTSRACQRRLNYMLKNQSTADNVALFLEDVKQDLEIVEHFQIPEGGVLSKSSNEARLERDFKPLVELLMKKYKDDPKNSAKKLVLPKTVAEVEKEYTLVFPTNTSLKKSRFSEPETVTDIQAGVVNALITSSLCSASDKKSWAYQLFKIYQQYPDQLLRNVMANLRENKMVSLKKHYNKSKVKEGNYLPLSSAPYQLSVTFSHTFLCRYQYDIYTQSWQLARKLLTESVLSSDDYTEIVINQEGGFAATVTGLMAKEKMQFRTEVPEQLVVLDPNMAAVDENYVRILQRYKELLRNAGSMDSSDYEMMRSPSKLTSTALFTKAGSEQRQTVERISEEKEIEGKEKTFNTDDDNKIGRESQVVFQEGDGDTRSNTTLAKSASRIALYMMREEMKESPLESNPVQHSHDFFVISSCSVYGRLLKQENSSDREEVNFTGLTVDKSDLPGDYDSCKEVLERYALDVNGKSGRGTQCKIERRSNVPLTAVDFDLVRAQCLEEGWSENDLTSLSSLCKFVETFGVMGATKQDVKRFKTIGVKKLPVEEVLQCALNYYLVVEVGVVEQKFVAYKHCRDWLLHSFKLNRSNEEVGNVKFAGKLYQGHGPKATENDSQEMEEEIVIQKAVVEPEKSKVQEMEIVEKTQEESSTVKDVTESAAGRVRRRSGERLHNRRGSLDENTGGEDIRCNALWKNPQVGVKMSREVQEACERINWGSVEEVLVTIRPWIRVDGTLNRRVLDRLLGAMLGVVMQWPGQTVSVLLARFSPAVQPAHSRELVTLLDQLGCVQLLKLCRPAKPGLFTKHNTVTLEKTTGVLDEDTELVVEAEVDAIVRLGMFIGDKVYHTDFACQCPCHPDRRM